LFGLAQRFQGARLFIGGRRGRGCRRLGNRRRGNFLLFGRLLFGRFRGCLGRGSVFGLTQGLKSLGLVVRTVGGALGLGGGTQADGDTTCHDAEFSVSHNCF
jgi:hypothetical protein